MRAARAQALVIGLSGGLDSTLALLVSLEALKRLGLPKSALCALTLPGPGTSEKTLGLVGGLAEVLGLTLEHIDIGPAVAQHLADLGHDGGTPDVTFENAQARERTQILFNRANQLGGLVVGTGDLSELALGWCTFNADHMASYNVNGSVPKTLIADLVRAYAAQQHDEALGQALEAVLALPISPELIPGDDPQEVGQLTEAVLGPYEVHDFYLYYALRFGMGPEKLRFLARRAFADRYAPNALDEWLDRFFSRFHAMQFKRTTLPPGPKVGTVSLSPRGDWRMPDETTPSQR
jgi:NAD+ synthase (glutamine-hydrolysing)